MVTNLQFDRIKRLASAVAGIQLFERHREVLARRGRRLGILNNAGLDSLLCAAEEGKPAARQQFLCLLTTKFTAFFRHPRHFEIAASHAVRVAQQGAHARFWSAAAATGEEPYSLAIALIEAFQCEHPPADIIATDLDEDALATAQRGEYRKLALRSLTPARRKSFFLELEPGRRWGIAPAVRRVVEFQALNLVSPHWFVEGPVDVIFCRNVLMYLGLQHRQAVLERMAFLLAPDGLLMLDPAENLGKAAHLFKAHADGVYSLRRATCPSAGVNVTVAP